MIKKLLLGTVLIIMQTTAIAHKQGINFAVELGGAFYQAEHNILDVDPINPTQTIFAQGNQNGLNGKLSAGYLFSINENVSTNVTVNFNGFTKTTHVTNVNSSTGGETLNLSSSDKLKNSLGINFNPMFKLNEQTSMFAIIGYQNGYFEYSLTDQDSGEASETISGKCHRNGVEYGLGFITSINDKLEATLGVSKSDFDKKQIVSSNDYQFSNKFSIVRANIGLSYFIS